MEKKEKTPVLSEKDKAGIKKMVDKLNRALDGQDTTTFALEYALGIFVAHNVKMMADNLHLNGQEAKFFAPIFMVARAELIAYGIDIDEQLLVLSEEKETTKNNNNNDGN